MAKPRKRASKKRAAAVPRQGRSQFVAAVDDPSISQRPLVGVDELNPLGGASRDELASIVSEEFGADPNLEASEMAIAIDSLSKVVAARMAHADWPNDPKQLAVFMISDRVRELAVTLDATREPILDNGSRSIAGKLWVAAPTLVNGYFATFAATDPGGVFEEVKLKGIGDRPALVFDPSATDPEIRYYPFGLNEDGRVQRFSIANEIFTVAALDKVLRQFHEDNIITPDAALSDFNPWSDGRKYIPRERTEAFLQGMLKMILSIAFGKCRIDFEVRGTEGRCDLLITSRSTTVASGWISHAALELKVLRSFTSSGRRVSAPARTKAVSDGLLQVIAYRRERDAQEGMLCCFDMCLPKHSNGATIFNGILPRAKRNKIELRHYRLYGTSADLRTDKYGNGSSPT
jgi:hypothetical protein